MSKTAHTPVGIDLGTTYSVIASLDDVGRPQTLNNAEGDRLTPSVVFFDGAQVIVGKEALKALSTEAASVADCAKREMGSRVYHKLLQGRQYPPEVIQAWVLNKLRQDAQWLVDDLEKVVITVPAYFDEVRRKATQDAGYMAGFDVLDIINEPTAAAVSFGYQEGFFRPDYGAAKDQRILVYDLGGGTFDVTVMEIRGTDFNTLATDGDVQLGGHDWDQRMVDFVAEEFIRRFGLDPREDDNAAARLWRECEDVKRALTARLKAPLTYEFQGQTLRLEVTRDQFQNLTQDLLDRTAFTTRQTLQAAGLHWKEVDRVLLVGGSTRMPGVSAMLKELSGRTPDNSVSPDEAVAHGAALHAGHLLHRYAGKSPRFNIRNVNSHSLGVVALEAVTKQPRNAVLIPRNTPLPVAAKRSFSTQKAAQKSILVQIVEGESAAPEECAQLGKCVVRDLPADLPARTPIEVAFRYAANGRLSIGVKVGGTNTQLRHELQRENSLTPEQLDSWRKYICGKAPGKEAGSHGSPAPGTAPAK